MQDARGNSRAADRLTDQARAAGRFAPSPTGPLHVGSLIAAVASRCEALGASTPNSGWQLRIDDIDPPREQAGARTAIPRSLALYGMSWQAPIRYQSDHLGDYQRALETLASRSRLFSCQCTRAQLRGRDRYPGHCHARVVAADHRLSLSSTPWKEPGDAIRLRLDGFSVIDDVVQGRCEQQHNDVVLRRRDGLVAYPLASAIDDAGVDAVVRGADLLETTAAQQAILEALALPLPQWVHVPVAVDNNGQKLSKSTAAKPIDAMPPLATLQAVWSFLGQEPFSADTVDRFWQLAIAHWSVARVPRVREQLAAGFAS